MADHKKPDGPVEQPKTVMSKEDGRLIIKAIESRWDDNNQRYQMGWSDVKVAEAEGAPVEWVKLIRERDFGGTGDDPSVIELLEQQIAIRAELDAQGKLFAELQSSVADTAAMVERNQRQMEAYRDNAEKLRSKVHRMGETVEKMKPPFHKAG